MDDRVEEFVGSVEDLVKFLKATADQIAAGRLVVDDGKVSLPSEDEVELKVKYGEEDGSARLTIKVTWDL